MNKSFLVSFSFLFLASLTSCTEDKKVNEIKLKEDIVSEKITETDNKITGTIVGVEPIYSEINKEISYTNPGGEVKVTFIIKLKDEIIESVTVSPMEKKIKSFAEGSSVLIGKNINDLDGISAIGGASLVTEAFKEAIKSK